MIRDQITLEGQCVVDVSGSPIMFGVDSLEVITRTGDQENGERLRPHEVAIFLSGNDDQAVDLLLPIAAAAELGKRLLELANPERN